MRLPLDFGPWTIWKRPSALARRSMCDRELETHGAPLSHAVVAGREAR